MFKMRKKGQSTLEYVILVGFVVSALIAMGVYMKRGFQGKLRESTDQIGGQYSAQHTSGSYTIESSAKQHEVLGRTGDGKRVPGLTRVYYEDGASANYSKKTGYETVEDLGTETGDEGK